MTDVSNTDRENLSGLEQMQGFAESRLGRRGIGSKLGFQISEVEKGRVVFTATPTEDAYNPLGTVHGGYLATLLDSALGCAVHSSLKPKFGYTTLELKVSYLRAMTTAVGAITAEGRVIQSGRRAAFAEGEIRDGNGRVYATATTTCLVFEK